MMTPEDMRQIAAEEGDSPAGYVWAATAEIAERLDALKPEKRPKLSKAEHSRLEGLEGYSCAPNWVAEFQTIDKVLLERELIERCDPIGSGNDEYLRITEAGREAIRK